MPELRREFLTGEWVSIAEERGNRPHNYKKTTVIEENHICPFCPENSHLTPKATYQSPSGLVRAIPNKYPLVSAGTDEGYGFHEVIIDTPTHKEGLHEFSTTHIAELFQCLQNRLVHFSANPRIQYIQVFKNDGIEAGATIPHSHWQIAAMPLVPFKQELMQSNLQSYYKEKNACYLCEGQQAFTIAENESWMAYTPYASKFPYEVHLLPKRHTPDFKELEPAEYSDLGDLLQKVVNALLDLFPGLNYNICFQNTPNVQEKVNKAYTHFYLQLIPRLGSLAGFELSTGCYINSVKPESAAKMLRAYF